MSANALGTRRPNCGPRRGPPHASSRTKNGKKISLSRHASLAETNSLFYKTCHLVVPLETIKKTTLHRGLSVPLSIH